MYAEQPVTGVRRARRVLPWVATLAVIGCAAGIAAAIAWPADTGGSGGPVPDRAATAQTAPSGTETTQPAVVTNARVATDRLASIVTDIQAASGLRYSGRDSAGHSLDTMKIIAGPRGISLGVYHFTDPAGSFTTAVAISRDLLHWSFQTVLATHASQPALAAVSDGSYVLVAEADDHGQVARPSRWLQFWHYPSLDALLHAASDRTFTAPRTLGTPKTGVEGTPNIYAATASEVRVGFHYLAPGRIDREGTGVLTDFRGWTTRPDTALDAALSSAGALGKHGDRDCVSAGGHEVLLVEAERTKGGGWEIYLYDRVTHRAQSLNVTTPSLSAFFANPSMTVLPGPSGRSVLAVTLFVPLSGSAPNEAGELVLYRNLSPSDSFEPCG